MLFLVLLGCLIRDANSFMPYQPRKDRSMNMSMIGGAYGSRWSPYSIKQVETFISEVEEIFWEYVKTDAGVQEAMKHLTSCRWLKLIRRLEHHKKFKKLKVLLAKNGIMDLSYKKLAPMKRIMTRMNITVGPTPGVTPDFSNLMSAIEAKLDEIPVLSIYLYNVYHSQISKRIQESSTAGIIQHFLDDIMTLPVSDLILHELIGMSFNFNSVLHLLFATLSYYDNVMSKKVQAPSIKQIAKYMDDSALLASIIKDIY